MLRSQPAVKVSGGPVTGKGRGGRSGAGSRWFSANRVQTDSGFAATRLCLVRETWRSLNSIKRDTL